MVKKDGDGVLNWVLVTFVTKRGGERVITIGGLKLKLKFRTSIF